MLARDRQRPELAQARLNLESNKLNLVGIKNSLKPTLQAFTLIHGTVAGNKVKLDAPKMQLVDVDETEYDGTLALKFNTTFNPNTGNDEFTITAL